MFSMFMSTLPDLTPRDPHTLWYTSRHAPASVPHHLLNTNNSSAQPHDAAQAHQPHPRDRDHRRALAERTALARLRHDEALMERRRSNVANYGSGWLKPPGVPKTLFQMREERREAEEHAEAMRREAQMQAQMGMGEDEQMMEEGEDGGEGEQDLDEDIPEAEGFGFDGEDDTSDEEDQDEEETVDEGDGGGEDHAGAVLLSPAQAQVRDLRAAEDLVREIMARGEDGIMDASEVFAAPEDGEQMLEEDDLVTVSVQDAPDMNADISMAMDMDMDADLDGEIPEGDDDVYEHTDSEEDISDEASREVSFVRRSSGATRPHGSRLRRSMPRSSMRSSNRASLAQSDVDISGLLSGDGSSFMDSSPHPRRRGG